MARKRYSSEQIIGYLRETEILQAKGSTIPQIFKKIVVTEQTYYHWRKEYGSLSVDQAKRLKEEEYFDTKM
jgi:putative transposase